MHVTISKRFDQHERAARFNPHLTFYEVLVSFVVRQQHFYISTRHAHEGNARRMLPCKTCVIVISRLFRNMTLD